MSSNVTSPLKRIQSGRTTAFLMLALFVFGQAYSFVHHATTEHRVCYAEEGLVHGTCGHETCETATLASDFEVESSSEHWVEKLDHELHDDQNHHEHGVDLCSVLAYNEFQKWTPAGPIFTPRLALEAASVTRPALWIAANGIPIFRLAPKQSPPEAA